METELTHIKKSCACGAGSGVSIPGCKSNGGCSSGGCNKMNVYDWLSDMNLPIAEKFDVLEVRFKNGRKDFYRNIDRLNLTTGDAVVVEVSGGGHHVGYVSLQGELVRLQMLKRNVANGEEVLKVYRIASQRDLEKFAETQSKEKSMLSRSRQIIDKCKLSMKLSDIEFQADGTKATFFYSADDRVDFRELIKLLASEFRIRIEMRQISLRQEAGRLGGIGVCGRELCCSTWLSDFKNVSTSAARYQNLSLNPAKLSGQCGRLKCCLNYELDSYVEALNGIPDIEKPLLTGQGEARLQKTDIFRKIMWFGFRGEDTWYPVSTDRVTEIIELNSKGVRPDTLAEDKIAEKEPITSLNSDLVRMDQKFKTKGKKKKAKRGKKFFKKQNPSKTSNRKPSGGKGDEK